MKRAYVVNQADLRMDGDLAMNVKRVLPVSQADFATAVANGQQWNVKRYHVVNTLDNMRGGTLRILKVNAPAPGVQRAFLTSEAVMVTLMGVPPLVLPDAIDGDIVSLKAFGGCEQVDPLDPTAVPTPDAPIDIVCNNGVLKVRHRSGLPWGYTLLDFVTNASGTRLDTGIFDDIDDFSVEIRAYPSLGSWYICQSRANSTAPIYGLSGASSGAKISFGAGFSGGTGSVTSDISRNTSHIYTVIGSHKNGVTTLYVKDETTEEEDTQTTTYDTNNFTAASSAIGVWGQSSNTVSSNNGIYYLKIRKGGVLVADYVPCQYNGENGFYDFVTKTFLGATAETINAGSPVSDPVVAYADGTVETIAVKGPNLWNMNSSNLTKSVPGFLASSVVISDDGTISATNSSGNAAARFTLSFTAARLGLVDGETYTIKVWATDNNFTTNRDSTIVVNGSQNAFQQSSPISKTWTQSSGKGVSMTLYFAEYANGSTAAVRVQVSRGSSIDGFTPYSIQTATAEMLLKVGDYQDEQEILSGAVTRNVGVKVLDGTENWILSGGTGVWANFQSITGVTFGTTSAVCTHSAYAGADVSVANMNQNEFSLFANGNIAFKNANTTSTSDWTTFLATQYVAGTPVIVVYPLATATTESVTPQPMQTTQGDNVVEITQASIDGLELEVTYMAGVSLTVEEVEDAQLSPDVEVTIQ